MMFAFIFAILVLDDSYFESFHKYTLEWQPPSVSKGHAGYISWYHDGKLLLHLEGASIEQLTGAQIPAEPMYMILNIAMSQDWGLTRDYALDEDVNGEMLPLSEREKCEHIRGTTRPCFDCHREECACWLPPKLRYNCSSFKEEFKVDYIRLFQVRSCQIIDSTVTILYHNLFYHIGFGRSFAYRELFTAQFPYCIIY